MYVGRERGQALCQAPCHARTIREVCWHPGTVTTFSGPQLAGKCWAETRLPNVIVTNNRRSSLLILSYMQYTCHHTRDFLLQLFLVFRNIVIRVRSQSATTLWSLDININTYWHHTAVMTQLQSCNYRRNKIIYSQFISHPLSSIKMINKLNKDQSSYKVLILTWWWQCSEQQDRRRDTVARQSRCVYSRDSLPWQVLTSVTTIEAIEALSVRLLASHVGQIIPTIELNWGDLVWQPPPQGNRNLLSYFL